MRPMTLTRKFTLGAIVATPGALTVLETHNTEAATLLTRHMTGDWGKLDPEDWQANEDALKNGDRILSSYILADGTKVWIITEWDRSVTTILLPEE